jgi:RsiW-degrading membrane proteinase PrsW (M82 family)
MNDSSAKTQKWILLSITVALIAWGLFHAYGAFSLNQNPWRPVVVLTCVGGFLAFWWAMLATRKT